LGVTVQSTLDRNLRLPRSFFTSKRANATREGQNGRRWGALNSYGKTRINPGKPDNNNGIQGRSEIYEVSILLLFISSSGLSNKFSGIVLFSDAYLKDAFRILSNFLYHEFAILHDLSPFFTYPAYMTQFSSHFARFLCLLSTVLLLSSCGSKKTTLYPLPASDIASPVSALSSDPELLLVESEPDQCLTEELEMLRQTGAWQPQNTIQAEEDPSEAISYDFPIVINKQVEAYLNIFQNRQKKAFRRWLERSAKYLPMIHKELREAGLPEDLAYLAMIESGYNQRAYSRSRAVGLWQFMKGTGKDYNLRIDSYVDERRHALKSTKAAVALLSDLYAKFGDWHLAVAAYNAGGGKIGRGLKRYKTNDFWNLAQKRYLKLETKRYVPKLIAAIIIAKDPEKYGFSQINFEAPIQYETLRVGPGLSLDAVALICDTSGKKIKQLNQELKTGKTPLNKRHYDVQIPVGRSDIARANLPRLSSVVSTGYKTHIIRKGDTLSAICRRYNINKTTLLKTNNLRTNSLIAGKHLRIPYSHTRYRLLAQGASGAAASDDLVLHTIKKGETISKIAAIYNVPADLIVTWNGLKSIHKIRAGQQLALYIEGAGRDSAVATPRQQTVASPVAESPQDPSLIVFSKQKKWATTTTIASLEEEVVSWYRVRRGDSLWTIARRFNLSTKQLKSWNKLTSNRIQPGIKLKIKKV
jgi:membrane-bound lytic murein transglycosylase D